MVYCVKGEEDVDVCARTEAAPATVKSRESFMLATKKSGWKKRSVAARTGAGDEWYSGKREI